MALAQPAPAATDTALLKTQEGTAALLRGKFDQAVESFDQALKTPICPAPALPASIAIGAWRFGASAGYEDALKDFNRSIELSNGSAATYNNRANVLSDLGRYDQAIADLDRAIALAPPMARPTITAATPIFSLAAIRRPWRTISALSS